MTISVEKSAVKAPQAQPLARPLAPAGAMPPVRRPQFGPKSVGSFVPRLTKPAFERYGFSAATLITDWAQIVGADLARATQPERLKWPKLAGARSSDGEESGQGRPGATLVLCVDGGRALDIQYKARQIIERINAYFGYRAVADIRILQGPIDVSRHHPTAPAVVRPASPPPAEVVAVADEGLRDALARMAAGLERRARAGT